MNHWINSNEWRNFCEAAQIVNNNPSVRLRELELEKIREKRGDVQTDELQSAVSVIARRRYWRERAYLTEEDCGQLAPLLALGAPLDRLAGLLFVEPAWLARQLSLIA